MSFGTDVREEALQGLNVFARVVRNGCDSSVRRRQTEIDQFDVRAIPGDKDIIRLEIMVDELQAMDVFERIRTPVSVRLWTVSF